MPTYYDDVERCVTEVIEQIGQEIVLGIPLGLGKPNHFVNALYRRAKQDPAIRLRIMTALTLEKPKGSSEIEQRFLGPLVDRIFGDYPNLDYIIDLRKGDLPDNISLQEFYFKPGAFLNSPTQQQNYICCNYTDVAKVFADHGANVIAQMIAKKIIDNKIYYSLSGNTDVTLDLLPLLLEQRRQGKKVICVGQVNNQLPFMYRDALIEPTAFDLIIDQPAYDFTLFSTPNMAVDSTDFMIGLHAGALIKDGGTLQIGIGSLGDAIVYACQLRQRYNEIYRTLLTELRLLPHYASFIEEIGGTAPFQEGLYGSSEMLVNGFWYLYQEGILKRRVYDHVVLQSLINEGGVTEGVTPELIDLLLERGAIQPQLSQADFSFLQHFGIFRQELQYKDSFVLTPTGERIPADLNTARESIIQHCLGDRLCNGIVMHGGFFLGPRSLYAGLRSLDEAENRRFCMTGVSHVNQLYGNEILKSLQRRRARFINTTIMVTLTGAAVSDGLEDGHVISGVGGQYNFVAMANALPDARSILILRSTRRKGTVVSSNIVWNYGHITIPRHLRDIVVTEYGIADLRGKADKDVIAALLNITDSRFQDGLLEKAKQAGKIGKDYEIPSQYRDNTPQRLEMLYRSYRKQGFFPDFPFGTDLTELEITLGKALNAVKSSMATPGGMVKNFMKVMESLSIPEAALPYLQRLQLDKPATLKEQVIQKLLVAELVAGGHLHTDATAAV
ncbi:MAG: acetyl-CoA hydrolase/transferase C-terminal domain-containing protein [Candidatus Competibacteraceae bacterium]